jgi:hypothetical protein
MNGHLNAFEIYELVTQDPKFTLDWNKKSRHARSG